MESKWWEEKMVQTKSQSIPFKVNGANVMPIIFASSFDIISTDYRSVVVF